MNYELLSILYYKNVIEDFANEKVRKKPIKVLQIDKLILIYIILLL